METAISHMGYGIPKEPLSEKELVSLRNELTVSPHQSFSAGPNVITNEYPVYKESSKKIYVPKFYGLCKFGVPKILKIPEGDDISVPFNGYLRDEQKAPVEAYLKAAHDPTKMGGILNLPCAFGKTALSIYIMCKLAKKTLVIVHKEFLVEQWHERISTFAPTAQIGIIQGKKVDVDGKDVVIALLQSLSLKEYPKDTFSSFGLVIVDEIHRTGAEVFSRALAKVNFRYALGLSATLTRKDGLSKVFKWFIGDVVYKVAKREDDVIVKTVTFQCEDPEYCNIELLGNGKVNMSKMINNICEYGARTEFIIGQIRSIKKRDPTRKILVLSDRRGHLSTIASMLSEGEWGYYYGGMKPDDLKVSESKDIILGTYQMAQEGLDIKGLDTLVLASPKSDVIQATGRILRDKPCDRRNIPLIIDIVDDFSVFEGQAKRRLAYYKRCSYCVENAQNVKKSSTQTSFAFRSIT